LKVSNSDVIADVGEIKITGAGGRTALVIGNGSTVEYDSRITLDGTGDVRVEIENGANFTAKQIVSEAAGAKIQANQNGAVATVKDIIVEENSGLSFQTWSNNPSDSVTYNVENIVLKEGATLKTVVEPGWSSAQIKGDNINLTLGEGAVADFGAMEHVAWSTAKINVDANAMNITFTGEDAGSAKVYVSTNSDLIKDQKEITVTATGASNTGNVSADLGKLANMVKLTNDIENHVGDAPAIINVDGVKLTQEASSIYDAASGIASEDGSVKNIKVTKNSNVYGITENNALNLIAWRAEVNDMNKRLGELRNANGEHGVWVRMVRGEAEYESVKNQYNQYQMGYDAKLRGAPSWTVGAAFNYTEGDTSYTTGNADNKHVGFSVYGSKLNDDGSFIDLIAKYARLENDFDTTMGSGDYSSNGYSVSAEYGKRFTNENGMWIEPQVELTYGTVGSANYKMGNIDVAQDNIDSMVGRVGFSLGKNINKGNVYARASYLYDFDGETNVSFEDGGKFRSIEQDLGGGWWEVGVGTNINLSKATYVYADVEKTFGGEVDTNWQWNLGVRYSF
jgi:outer membrane autotransporter protein